MKKLYIETYGCQMNVVDSEVVVSVMNDVDFEITEDINEADLILVNTCSIRENAEQRVRQRLHFFNKIKKTNRDLMVGVIGCMAERLKEQLLEEEKIVDIVVGPDAYRDLPNLVKGVESGQRGINVLLSREETYAEINPVRLGNNKISAYIAIMRGCENMCNYCIVPYTRGAERSRDPKTIIEEVKTLQKDGYKEVILLGQNVNSFNYEDNTENIGFAQLLEMVAKVDPNIRVRFSTSNPKDMSDDVMHMMVKYHNICKAIHLPVQAGSSRVLGLMNRKYDREWYMERIEAIRRIVPECSITTDFMVGFCGETEEDQKETLSLMEWAKFDLAYMYKYSERDGTYAARKMKDDVSDEVKSRRLTEVIDLQHKISAKNKDRDIGNVYEVLVEGVSKKSDDALIGRNTHNMTIVFPKENHKIGDYVNIKIVKRTSATLIGEAVKE